MPSTSCHYMNKLLVETTMLTQYFSQNCELISTISVART